MGREGTKEREGTRGWREQEEGGKVKVEDDPVCCHCLSSACVVGGPGSSLAPGEH